MILPCCLRFLKRLRRRLNSPQDASHIHLHDVVELFRRHIRQRLNLRNAGIVDHNVEPAEFLPRVSDGGINIVAL